MFKRFAMHVLVALFVAAPIVALAATTGKSIFLVDKNSGYGRGEVANSATIAAAATGTVLVGKGTTANPAFVAMSGDATISSTGVVTVSGASASGMSDLASTVNAKGASLIGVEDAALYWTGTTQEAVDIEIKTQIGATTSTTYNFTNGTGTRLTDNDAVYAALNKLDVGFVDLKATTNTKGASLVGVEDSGSLLTGTNLETVTTELAKYVPITLADPGTGVAIGVTRSATVNLTIGSAGAETNTLAIPTFVGQRMILNADTVGTGTRAITAAQALNQTGNTIMTFAAARDNCELVAITIGGALRWQVGANDGVALSGP